MVFSTGYYLLWLLLWFDISVDFCWGAASGGSCSRQEVSNAVLKREYNEIEEFDDGASVQYECKLGYSIEGRSSERRCDRGIWSSVRFTCTPILCPELPRIKNGRIFQDTSDGIRNNYESVSVYTCNSGYLINGNEERYTRECQAGGTWTGKEPYCDGGSCSRQEVSNAVLKREYNEIEEFDDGASVQYECKLGYSIEGRSSERRCDRGIWSSVRFTCTPILCPELPRIKNGRIFQDTSDGIRNNYESVSVYTCNSGYLINGNEERYTRECQAGGTWTGKEPYCDGGSCSRQEVSNAVLKREYNEIEEFDDGASVQYECKLGYSIEGRSSERRCDRGIWSSVRFTCTPILCPELPRIKNGRIFQDTSDGIRNNYESVSVYTCNSGYLINGNEERYTRECQAGGTWTGKEPYCDAIVCPELPRIQNGRIFQDTSDGIRNNYESVSVYTCNSGYLINGNEERYTRECQAGGTWTGKEPYCDVPRCDYIQPFYGGEVVYFGDRKRWTLAFYRCNEADDDSPGYSLFPNNVKYSECNDSLKWSPDPPACYEKAIVEKPSNSYIQGPNDILLHGESYTLLCRPGYEMYKDMYLERTRLKITNNNGTLSPKVPICEEARCDPTDQLQTVVEYEDGSKVTSKILSGTKVRLSCPPGYDFYSYDKPMNKPVLRDCKKGNIKRAPTCEKERCLFSGYPSNSNTYHRIYRADRNLLAPGQYIYHDEKIQVFCRKGYELHVKSTQTYLKSFTSKCSYGQFDKTFGNFPVCEEERCLFKPNQYACMSTRVSGYCRKREFKVQSGSSVTIKCKNGYKLYRSEDGSSVEVNGQASVKCSKGGYFEGYKCIPEPTSPPDGNTMEESNSDVNDEMSNENQQPTEQSEGCELSSDERYIYTDDDSRDVKPGSFISSGTTLIVMCREIDLYEYLTDYDSYDNETSEPTVTCTGKELSHFDLNCRDVTQDKCLELQNGKVTLLYGQYNVSCNKGFSLNLFIPEKSLCICEDGVLKSIYGNQKPACLPAICEPNCTNGGVCYKDNKCKCKHLTEGIRCEKVLCDVKCNGNGGECVAPGVCTCPAGRFGSNCERRGCKFPERSAKPKISKIIYKPGDKLSEFKCDNGYIVSSYEEMTCQDDGTWSDIVECVKAAVYLISVKTVDDAYFQWEGTDAKVYIYLHGLNGKTNRIYLNGNFEANDLDETRVMAEDVRPITEVVVGHDGSGFNADWYLEFVSIYVENMNEYYVFRRSNEPVWVTGNDDVTLPRHENCIHTFDGGHKWFPKWRRIGQNRQVYIGRGHGMSLRACQQKCTELTTNVCDSVQYNRIQKTCWGVAVSSIEYFSEMHGTWDSPVYIRSCKQ